MNNSIRFHKAEYVLSPVEFKSPAEEKMRSLKIKASQGISICGAFVLTCLLFTFGSIVNSFDEPPTLITKTQGIPMSEPQEEQEQDPIETQMSQQPETPQTRFTPEVVQVNTPPIKIDYTINVNTNIGMQVPAPPSFNPATVSAPAAYAAGQLDEQPTVSFAPRPQYPQEARRAKLEGRVIARITINSNGQVINAQILKGVHSDIFEKESLAAIKRWRFKPGKLNGKDVATIVEIPLVFSLK